MLSKTWKRPAQGDRFLAVGKVKKPGKTITVTEGDLFAYSGDQKKLVATMVGTIMAVYGRPDLEH